MGRVSRYTTRDLSTRMNFRRNFCFSRPQRFCQDAIIGRGGNIQLYFHRHFGRYILTIQRPGVLPIVPFKFGTIQRSNGSCHRVHVDDDLCNFYDRYFVRFVLGVVGTFNGYSIFLFCDYRGFCNIRYEFYFGTISIKASTTLVT